MEINEILNYQCNTKQQRKKLLKQVIDLLKKKEIPTKEELKRIIQKLSNKYKFNLNYIIQKEGKYISSVKGISGYTMYYSNSEYEALLKYILLVKALLVYKKKLK